MDYQNNVTIIKEVAYYNELRNLINNIACVNVYNDICCNHYLMSWSS